MTLYFVRHGQTQNNVENKMNPGDDDDILTPIGRDQAKKAGKDLKEKGTQIDVIISSNLSRARETGSIIAKEINYTGIILQDTRLREQDGGVFKGKGRDEIKVELGLKSDYEFRKAFKDKKYNQVEDITEFDTRIGEFLQDIQANYPNKNILLVGHSGTSRGLLKHIHNIEFEYIYFEMPGVKNAEVINLEEYSY